jgi:hypothetical protein
MKISRQQLRKIIAEEISEGYPEHMIHEVPPELLDLPTVAKMVKTLQTRMGHIERLLEDFGEPMEESKK